MSSGYGDLAYVMLCNTLVLWRWSVFNPGVSSGGTSSSKDTEFTGSYNVSVLVKKMEERETGGDIVTAKSSREDLKATRGFVSNLPHPQVNKIKQHTMFLNSCTTSSKVCIPSGVSAHVISQFKNNKCQGSKKEPRNHSILWACPRTPRYKDS